MLRPLSGFQFPGSGLEDGLPPGNSVTIELRERQVPNYLGPFLKRAGIGDARILQDVSHDGRLVVISQAATREALAEALRRLDFTVLGT